MSQQIELRGKNGSAIVYTDLVEETAVGQIINMMNAPITENAKVRIMPDVHAGKGSTIGTAIQLLGERADWKVSPNIVGVDIGCGMMSYKLKDKELDLEMIDNVISKFVPSGQSVHNKVSKANQTVVDKMLEDLTFEVTNPQRIAQSLGTLGGGNHFIEIARDQDGYLWLTVHSGSRNLGLQVAQYHQNKAFEQQSQAQSNRETIIAKLKAENRESEIEAELEKERQRMKNQHVDKALAHLSGEPLEAYLHDLVIAQSYAFHNRQSMLQTIIKNAELEIEAAESFDSIHNYMDVETGILRKGATDASKDVKLIIPLNMRDGSLICVGKGNDEWNQSAPHGAGRMMSRSKAKAELAMKDYQEQMKDVYTSSVVESTLDEAPGAYKPMAAIIDNIGESVEILHHIKPVYNFKAH